MRRAGSTRGACREALKGGPIRPRLAQAPPRRGDLARLLRGLGRAGLGAGIGLTAFAPALAQETVPAVPAQGTGLGFPVARPQTPLLTMDQERLFTNSRFGQRVAAELSAASEELARQNRAIEAALSAEERDLTRRRPTLPSDEFQELAAAFDRKVVGYRRAQDTKARAFQRRDEAERQVFLRAALPVLSALVAELGAVAILDERAVLFAAQSIDVTDRAIARIDAAIGAGEDLSPPGPILPPDGDFPVPSGSPAPDPGTSGGVGPTLGDGAFGDPEADEAPMPQTGPADAAPE